MSPAGATVPEPPDVSVVVPLFNGRELIGPCLRSVPAGTEVIVVDDGSTDGAPELVEREFPATVVLRNDRNRGFGATSNRGLSAASGRVRVVLNSDATLHPGAIEALVAAFDDPAVGIAGARRLFPDGSHQTSAARFPTPASILTGSFLANELFRRVVPGRRFPFELGLSRADHEIDQDVDWVSGTCLAIRDSCHAALGGFDEAYHMYVEETDLCWRAWQAGWRVRYAPQAVVTHLGGGSTGDPWIHARRLLRSEARFMERTHGDGVLVRWRAARAVGAVVKIVAFAVPAPFDRRARTRLRWQVSALTGVLGRGWRTEPPGERAP